jgi:hypothetical protein
MILIINGYIDYLIKVFFVAKFCQFKRATTLRKDFFEFLWSNLNIYCQFFTIKYSK